MRADHRTVVAALRVVAQFDRLSLEQLKIEAAGRPVPARDAADDLTPADAARLLALINEHPDLLRTPRHPNGDA
jgi:hypothetical protein